MSWLGDIKDAFVGPLESTVYAWKTLLTDPGKLKPLDFVSLALPLPWQGGTIKTDVNNPRAIPYQAAFLTGAAAVANPWAAGQAAYAEAANQGLYGAEYTNAVAVANGTYVAPGAGVLANTSAPTFLESLASSPIVPTSSAPAAAGGGITGAISAVTSGTAKILTSASSAIAPALLAMQTFGQKAQQVFGLLGGGSSGSRGGQASTGPAGPSLAILPGSSGGTSSNPAAGYQAASFAQPLALVLLLGAGIFFLLRRRR